MSVIMMLRVKGDPIALETWTKANSDQVTKVADAGKRMGCMHHMFAAADGEIVVIDEWPDELTFQEFFASQPDIPKIMKAAGAKGDPQITFFRKMSMPDTF